MSSMVQTYENLRSSQRFQKRSSIVIRLIVALLLIFFSIFPVLWIISASFSSTQSLSTQTLIPARSSLLNYERFLGLDPGYTFGSIQGLRWIFNSVKVSTITTVLSLAITTMAAYAFSRMRFAGRVAMLKTILLIQVFPNLLALVAIYVLIFQVGEIIPALGLNTHAGLIMVYLGGSMGINIWLMKGFLDTIPRAIDESGMVDGASHFQIFYYLLGSFARADWSSFAMGLPLILVGSLLILARARSLNAFLLGDDTAANLGIDVRRERLMLLGLASLVTAAAVALAGLIGFVGLVVPHVVRLLVGPNARLVLPLSALFGAAFVILADLVARIPGEVPVGVVTAVVGAPVFLVLLRRFRSGYEL